MPKSPSFRRLLPGLALAALAPFTLSQQSSQPSQSQQPADQNPSETLKVNVNVVQLFFNVKDKHGALSPSLTKDGLEIAKAGKSQTIKYFAAESSLPLTLGIMI